MSTKINLLKRFIKELIKQELDEASTTGAIDGGEGPPKTPYAFSGGRKKDKEKEDKIAKAGGYSVVKEEITSAGYSEIGKRGRYLPLAAKEFIKALKKQDDREVIKNIEYIADLMDFMKDALKNKKYNESINEGITPTGYSAFERILRYMMPYFKDLQKALKKRDDKEVISHVEDIYEYVLTMRGYLKNTKYTESINEGKYHDYRNDESMTPKQKIGRSMREIRDSLNNLDKLVKMNVRLKNELKVDSRSYWKNTHKALNKISERLVKLANKVGQLQ